MKTVLALLLVAVVYFTYKYLDSCAQLLPFPESCTYEVSWR